jgi:hypothetical protein
VSDTPEAAAPAKSEPTVVRDMDVLVPVKVDGQERLEPLSKLVAINQLEGAARKRLDEANQMKDSSRGKIEFYDSLEQAALRDPEAAYEEFGRKLSDMAGRPVGKRAAAQDQAVEDLTDPQVKELREEMKSMKTEVAQWRRDKSTQAARAEIDTALATYPAYNPKNNAFDQEARDDAEAMLAAQKIINPRAPLEDLASREFAKHMRNKKQELTETKDRRLETAEATKTVSSSAGTPEAPASRPWKMEDVKNGALTTFLNGRAKKGLGIFGIER